MNSFDRLSPKQRLLQMVKEEAQMVKAHKGVVEAIEAQLDEGLLLAENEAISLDPGLHQLMLVHLDCKLAVARANLMVAEYCANKVKDLK